MIEWGIFDTGPLISAFQSDAIGVLGRLISKAYTGPVCMGELRTSGWAPETEAVVRDGFLSIRLPNENERACTQRIATEVDRCSRNKNPITHMGESEVIAMALGRELRGGLVLLDERAARSVASREGIHISGFPGLLILAAEHRLLGPEHIRQMLQQCREQGTHYSKKLIEFAYRRVKEVSRDDQSDSRA